MDILMHSVESLSSNGTFCLVYESTVFCCIGTSVLSFLLLSVERYHAVVYPLTHIAVFTRKRIYISITFMWIINISYGCLPLYETNFTSSDDSINLCFVKGIRYNLHRQIFLCIAVCVMIANGVLFIILARIVLRKSSRRPGSDQTRGKDLRHTRMALIISGLFLVFWGPFAILSQVPKPSAVVQDIQAWLVTLGLCNSYINWIIYGVRSKKFRKAFKLLLTCNRKRSARIVGNF